MEFSRTSPGGPLKSINSKTLPPLRIGTRDSRLAMWQAELVCNLLNKAGVQTEIVRLKSEGDIDLVTPLYAMGVQGVFTRSLDAALLNDRIDIAVHSMKDVPVQLPNGIVQAAVLERGDHHDLFVPHPHLEDVEGFMSIGSIAGDNSIPASIGTGSIRRKAQWMNRFPLHAIEPLRGNVVTRLEKLSQSKWAGAVFAAAGLERLGIVPGGSQYLDWMLPAPAQGAIMVACKEGNLRAMESCRSINHEPTASCTAMERNFLAGLLGGCSTPISAYARIENDRVHFKGNISSPTGNSLIEVEDRFLLGDANGAVQRLVGSVLQKGGDEIINSLNRDHAAN